ncbi:glycine betaine ABC transporter substrate-binding protein [Streptomyces geranii]|uniref:glycine betaine ABC transporter substrate-binding protein n=1 Tax=Streptomyces geranii TaxID=2058923 RepID=UPI000D043727|nr:glycine betaine ABC transporter substrate-binding protein [Streptomyces geranii]
MTAHRTARCRAWVVPAAVTAVLLLSGCGHGQQQQGTYASGGDPGQGPITLGADHSPESRVVAALYEKLLTDAGEQVTLARSSYASPADTAKAVVTGRLTLAPAYETTLLRALGSTSSIPGDIGGTLSMVLPVGITALPPAAAQHGPVIAVSRATARHHDLRSLADLADTHRRFTLGGPAAGASQAPSAGTLSAAYGVPLTPVGTSGPADLQVLRGTDPAIARDGLVVLTDPKGVIPPDHVFPLIGSDYAGKATRTALARLDTTLTTGQLALLASAVTNGQSPDQAATAWLRAKGMLA